MSQKRVDEILNFILEQIENLPDPPREKVKKEFSNLKELLLDTRSPRIMVLGRRGAGKSSLINAIFKDRVAGVGPVLAETGKAKWHTFSNSKGSIDILDTRGIGESTKTESAIFNSALDEVYAEVKIKCPDAVLFLCKAKEVDARIDEDIMNLASLREKIKSIHGYEIPVVGVVTQIDELDPKRVDPPYEHEEKKENIELAVNALRIQLNKEKFPVMTVIPTSAYAEYINGNMEYNNHWNIDVLVEYLIDVLPKSAQIELARLSALRSVQRKLAKSVVKIAASTCAAIAATPIPVADIFPITAIQIGMIVGIGYIGGREMSKESAKEFLVAAGFNVGVGFVLREAARAMVKWILPGGGEVISAGVAAAGTWAIGTAAIAYFIEGKTIEDAKKEGELARKKVDE